MKSHTGPPEPESAARPNHESNRGTSLDCEANYDWSMNSRELQSDGSTQCPEASTPHPRLQTPT